MISTSVYASFAAGSFRCYRSPDGRTAQLLGCKHETPRQAIAHTSGSYVDPLRASGGASTPVPLPPSGSGQSDAPSEPPRDGFGL